MDTYEEDIEVARAASSDGLGDVAIEPVELTIAEGRRAEQDAKIEAEIDQNLNDAETALDMAEAVEKIMRDKKDMFKFMQFQTGYKNGYIDGYRSGFRAGYRDYKVFKEAKQDKSPSRKSRSTIVKLSDDICIDPAAFDEADDCNQLDWDNLATDAAEAELLNEAQNFEEDQVEEDNAEEDKKDSASIEPVSQDEMKIENISAHANPQDPKEEAAKVVDWLTDETCESLSTEIAELKGLLKIHGTVSRDSAKQNPMVLKHFITKNAVAAVDRVNELRGRHPHCRRRPLTQSYRLCLKAATLANYLAAREEHEGLTEELENTLQDNVVTLSYKNKESLRMGLTIHRFKTSPRNAILPLKSVNHWYRQGKLFPYESSDEAAKYKNYLNFIQLLDCCCQYMGWAAAMADTGAVYTVALFDHIGPADPKTTSSMEPAIQGCESDDEEEFTDSEPDSSPTVVVRTFNYSAPPVVPMQQIFHSLQGVFLMFKDSEIENAPLEQQEAAAISICNLVTQRAHERIVQARRKHRRSDPLVLSQSLCNMAIIAANEMAVKEEQLGKSCEPSGNSIVFPDIGERMGVVTCRLVEFKDAAKESIDYWCRGSKTFPYGKPLEAVSLREWRQFAQLMDYNSQYMGWGASMTNSGVAYVVALFNNVGSTERKNLASLKRPIMGVRVMF